MVKRLPTLALSTVFSVNIPVSRNRLNFGREMQCYGSGSVSDPAIFTLHISSFKK